MKKFLFAFIFAVGVTSVHAAAPSSLTLSQLRTHVRFAVKDSNSDRQRYTDTELDFLINEGHRQLFKLTWPSMNGLEIAANLVANTTSYTITDEYMQISQCDYEGKDLIETTYKALNAKFPHSDWQGDSQGEPTHFYRRPGPRETLLHVFPAPDSASTGTLRCFAYITANTLVNDSDTPFSARDQWATFTDGIIYYPCYRVFVREGQIEKAKEYLRLWQQTIAIVQGFTGVNPTGQALGYRPGLSGADNLRQ